MNLSSTFTADAPGFRAHVEDSLSLVGHLQPGLERLIDLGSGQGFPAIPVAIMTGIRIEMIEADRRKAAFLTTALAALNLDGSVIRSRIEDADAAPAACVTARALAPLPKLIELARPFLTPGGYCLFLKGPAAHTEITDAQQGRPFEAMIIPTGSPRSNLVKITGLR